MMKYDNNNPNNDYDGININNQKVNRKLDIYKINCIKN